MTPVTTWDQRYAAALMNNYGQPKRVLERGEGARVWDTEGRGYLDFLGGIAVNALGHAHPALVEAVTAQLQRLGHISNVYASTPQIELAERLLDLALGSDRATETAGSGRVFFANSGAEANEAAFKLSRLDGRTHIVAMTGGFHGRTMGALALTSKQAYREPFEPLPGQVTFVDYGDVAALDEAVTTRTAAVVIEPIQGEAGVQVPDRGFLAAARDLTARRGALLWLDEVQTGIGRTGSWFAHRNADLCDPVAPDLITLAKGLGGGIPIGAVIASGPVADRFAPGNHGTTFGGNPVASAAGLAVLDVIERDGLLDHTRTVGEQLAAGLSADPRVVDSRGIGLIRGVTLTEPKAAEVVAAGVEQGFVLNNTSPTDLRFVPPLVIEAGQVQELVEAWPELLDAAQVARP